MSRNDDIAEMPADLRSLLNDAMKKQIEDAAKRLVGRLTPGTETASEAEATSSNAPRTPQGPAKNTR